MTRDGNVRPAATLVILRDAEDGPEVLLTIRPQSLRFMGGAAVFPGGAVGPGDLDPRWEECSNLSRAEAARRLLEDDPGAALGAYVCALREAYEEVGFIAGRGPLERIERGRADDGPGWLEHLHDLGVELDTASLVPAGRWVTPRPSPVRFDARFFVTRAPSDWTPASDPTEVDRAFWLSPRAALEQLGRGELLMAPPTISVIQRLADAGDVNDAIARLGRDTDDMSAVPLSVRIHPLIKLVLAPNPGLMTGPGTNTYIVGNHSACVVDPAIEDDLYLDAVMSSATSIESIFITHRHPDHTGGAAALVDRTGAAVRAWGTQDVDGLRVEAVADGARLNFGEASVECIHTPGHASDHLCVRLGDILFSGDTILGEGTAVIAHPDGNLTAYLESLRRLRVLPIARILPGHFRVVENPHQLIDQYLDHREARHKTILELLEKSDATVGEIVSTIYVDTPAELHPVAELTVLAHLEMARDLGQAVPKGQNWHRLRQRQEGDFRE